MSIIYKFIMADYAHMNKNSGNVSCDVVSAKKYITTKVLKTKKIADIGHIDVNGAQFHEGDISAKNMTLDGNLEISGVVIGSRDVLPMTEEQMRREQAYQNRNCASREQYTVPLPSHENNGDEQLYANKIANFSKGLPHNALGEVIPEAYDDLLAALANPYLLDEVELVGDRKLVNPLAGVAYDTEGADSHALSLGPAPVFASAEQAGEMVEDYWMALLRDINFKDYNSDILVASACTDLNNLSDFRGPKEGGLVTPQTLFRGNHLGCTKGPLLSQFLYLDCAFGALSVDQRANVPVAGDEFMQSFAEWKFIQEGNSPTRSQTFDATRRYLRNARDISQWVHVDELFQAYFIAALILLKRGCPLNPGNPYLTGHQNQESFGTLGGPEILATLAEVSTRALKAIWHQKWYVHRRCRPEAFAARVDKHKAGDATYPLHDDVLNSHAATLMHGRNGNYLLPQVFPEGSPMHPSYGAGHATVAGACCTVLKAMFDTENFVIADPKQPSSSGTTLSDYSGDTLTAEGEINKLANNIALGRNMAGVHWRTDASIELGEDVAMSVLRDRKKMYHPAENFAGFQFRKFDGTRVVV
jgi:hypothetical protein